MWRERGPAGIGVGIARRPVNDQVATHHINFFEIVMLEGNGGESPGIKTEQPAPAPSLFPLIQVTGQDFLFDTFRVSWRCFPAFIHVHLHEFQMGLRHILGPLLSLEHGFLMLLEKVRAEPLQISWPEAQVTCTNA
jgi:hypothetical protein